MPLDLPPSPNVEAELTALRSLDEVRKALGLVWVDGNFIEVDTPDVIIEEQTCRS